MNSGLKAVGERRSRTRLLRATKKGQNEKNLYKNSKCKEFYRLS